MRIFFNELGRFPGSLEFAIVPQDDHSLITGLQGKGEGIS